jgi:hypothetical protein
MRVSIMVYCIECGKEISEYELLIVFLQLLSMGSIFGVLGGIALLMHSFKHNDRNLKIAGFIYLVGIAILSLGVIPQYIDLLL